MKTLVTLCFMVLLGLVVAQKGRGPCGCRPVFDFCANDYTTYHSICEYKCKNPCYAFQNWYIMYDGPCSGQETIDQLHETIKLYKGYEYEPRTGSRYKVHTVSEMWSSADATCRAEGGYLAIINSKTEAGVLKELFMKHFAFYTHDRDLFMRYHQAFIGFKHVAGDNKWITIQGQSLAEAGFEEWSPDEPSGIGKSCGSMNRHGLLSDASCFFPLLPFICEA